jgi:hypothetical protein
MRQLVKGRMLCNPYYSRHRTESSDVYDGVADRAGNVENRGLAQEGSNGVHDSTAPVGINDVEQGYTQEGTSGTKGGSVPESSRYKRR